MRLHLCMLVAISVSAVCAKNEQAEQERTTPRTHRLGGKKEHEPMPIGHDHRKREEHLQTQEGSHHPRRGHKQDVDKSHHDKAKHNNLQENKHKSKVSDHKEHHKQQEDKHKPTTKAPVHVRHHQRKYHKLLGVNYKASTNAAHKHTTPTPLTTTATNHNGTEPHKGGVGQVIVAPFKTCPAGTRMAPNGYCRTVYE